MQMNIGVFVTGEANVSELTSFPRLNESGIRPFFVENSIRIFVPEDFVVLNEIDVIYLQAVEVIRLSVLLLLSWIDRRFSSSGTLCLGSHRAALSPCESRSPHRCNPNCYP
jgi:hypothetical protein